MNSQYALMRKDSVPTRDAWQRAITASGFPLELSPSLKPHEDSGYSPCTLMGGNSGFELHLTEDQETIDGFAEMAPNADVALEFCWGSDMGECACAMIATFALAKEFDAVVTYEGEAPMLDLQAFEGEVIEIIDLVRSGG